MALSFINEPIQFWKKVLKEPRKALDIVKEESRIREEERKKREEELKKRTKENIEGLGKQLRFKTRGIRQKIEPTLRKPIPEKLEPLARGIEKVRRAPRKTIDYAEKFGSEIEKTAKVTDEGLKSRFKGAYAMMAKYSSDAYKGENTVGKLMSYPSLIVLMPESFRKRKAEEIDAIAKQTQESAFRDLEVVENYIRENPLAVDVEQQPFLNKIRDPQWVARGLTLNAPSFLSSLGVTALVTLVTKNPVAGYTVGFGSAFAQEGGDSYNEALSQGVDEEHARAVGTVVGGINGMLEMIFPEKKLAELMGGKQIKDSFLKHLIREAIQGVIVESSTETVEEMVSNAARMTYDENADLLQGTPEAAFFGGLMGGIGSVGTTAIGIQGGLPNIQPGLTIKERTLEDLKPEEFLERTTGVKQSIEEYSRYLMADASDVKRALTDFQDYATINSKSDDEVNILVNRFTKLGEESLSVYKKEIEGYSGLKDEGSLKTVASMKEAANNFDSLLNTLKEAESRSDKVIALDSLISAEHSRGGKLLTYGYGITDIDRGDYFLNSVMDWLRDQKELAVAEKPEGMAVEEAVTPAVDLSQVKPSERMGFTDYYEVQGTIATEDIPKRSITTPEYRDEKVVAEPGRKVTEPIVAFVKDISDPNSPIDIKDGWHRVRQAIANKDATVPITYMVSKEQLQQAGATIPTKQPRTTTTALKKEILTERFEKLLGEAKSQEQFVKRVEALKEQLKKPAVRENRAQLKKIKTLINKHIEQVTGVRPERKEYRGRRAKQRLALWEMVKSDPEMEQGIEALEDLYYDLDELITGGRAKSEDIAAAKDMGLPAEGNLYIPLGKASFKGTQNRQWVQQSVPLVYMGNKSQMIDYIVRGVFNVGKKDLGDITPADVSHLKHYKRVYDLFGGSGLLTNLGKLLFRGRAKFFYNEFDTEVINALNVVRERPDDIKTHILRVAKYLKDNPGADWLAHFKLVFKEDADFRVVAKLIEATAGRTRELTAYKLNKLVKAVPNFSKIFANVTMTNKDAFSVMDKLLKQNGDNAVVFIDPPYLWSTGYAKGSEMERAEGFMKVMDYIEKLHNKGYKVVAFNNDPEIQAPKAGVESVHLDNIMGRLNQLSQDMVVVHGVQPIGTQREEIIITNTPESKESHNLVRQEEVERRVKELKEMDGGELSADLLEFFRDVSGKTRFVPPAQRITDGQIKRIRARRSRMHIRNREMIPVFDELLRENSFAKMTQKDGERLIDWLRPRNWEIIEKKIELVRQMSAKEKAEAVIGDRVVAKDKELEEKYGVIGKHNDVVKGVERVATLLPNVPNPEPQHSNLIHDLLKSTAPVLSPGQATKLLGIYHRWFVPLRMIVNVSKEEFNISKPMHKMVEELKLTKDEMEQVVFIQSNAEEQYKQKHPDIKITAKSRKVADYWQELSEAKYSLINRLREARGMNPLPKVKPRYISWIINENIAEALGMREGAAFYKERLKLARDLQAGLFTYDLHRIIDLWSSSSASYLKKNLYGALMQDRYDALYKVDPEKRASIYAKEIIDRDIHNLPPSGLIERNLRALGAAINRHAGWIAPKKIPIDPDLAESLLDTSFAKELQSSIEKGYLEIPRFKFPNLVSTFHAFFYPAKLLGNIGFLMLNRLQPFYSTPFVGLPNKLKGRIKMYFVLNPFNRKKLAFYKNAMEKTGYEYGRVRNDYQPMNFAGKWTNRLDLAMNLLVDGSEFMNRLENTIDFEGYLNKMAKDQNVTIPKEEIAKVAARMAAHINGLYGKGYSPAMQRSSVGRLMYTFQQFTINMAEVTQDMIDSAMSDEKARDLWTAWTRESLADEKVEQLFDNMPLKSRANFLKILMAFTIPVALMYSYWQRWNIAARAIPWLNPAIASDVLLAIAEWQEDPNKTTLDKLKKAITNTMRVTAIDRYNDAMSAYEYGFIETRNSKVPVFIEPTLKNIWGLLTIGRGVSDQYEEAFPSQLAKWVGGKTKAGKIEKLEEETVKEREQTRKDAIQLFKELRGAGDADKAEEVLNRMAEEGKINDKVLEKVMEFFEKEARGVGFLEEDISRLRDDKQAELILDELLAAKTADEAEEIIRYYKEKGLLTDNVIDNMFDVMKNKALEEGAGGFAISQ